MDKVIALTLVCKHELGIDPSDPEAMKALYLVFEDTHPAMIGHVPDIDVVERYHGVAGSATEMVARRLGLLELPGMETVLQDVNSNNNGDRSRNLRGGWLKGLNWSFVKLVREAYTFPHDESSPEADAAWRSSVIREFLPVCDAYIRYAAKPLELSEADFKAKRHEFEAFFPELNNNMPTHPLTLSGQAWYRFVQGEAIESIRDFVEKWLEWFDRAFGVDAGVLAALNRGDYRAEQFQFGRNQHGIVVQADDPRVVRTIFRQWGSDLVVVRNGKGQIAILPSLDRKMRPQMIKLFGELSRREPECWYREDRVESGDNPRLLNGSPAVAKPPSQIGKKDLITMIKNAFSR